MGSIKNETSLDQLSDSVVWSLLSLRLGYVEMERLNVASCLLLAMKFLENCTYALGAKLRRKISPCVRSSV